MSGHPQISRAERVGCWLGRGYRGLMQQEQRSRLWLRDLGIPTMRAKCLTWCLRLCALALLLSFFIALVIIVWGLWLIGRGVARSDFSYRTLDAEWRDGISGFGLYTRDEFRIDPHVFEDD
ncbi:Protein of unknown function [Pseudomonas cedrina]|uniref:DUF3742 domain-containing protein n=2 Tax=Pseudomonas cedrina TaxID=651740 RepID=A0A1V2K0D5_PSECE|nr:DUF3742 family protein [Pseudomonas cedrina]ONH50884.1 hypothetical protein BLL36_23520 [Pseudomonas cedrina subsp. cedrina]SDS61963.1 Protein of unknown function [Pseudomonas cedrina]